MKTIVETATGLSKYLFADDEAVAMHTDHVVVGEPPRFIVADLNAGNAVVYEGVTAPVDWVGNKYTFNGTDWVLNPDWVEPNPPA
jgi:hypothetical protein